MGATSVYFVEGSENLSAVGGVDRFQERIEVLGGRRTGGYRAECTLYHRGTNYMYLLKFSDNPKRRFSLVGDQLVEGDEELETILDRMKGTWRSRTSAKLEGLRYSLGNDIVVKVGTISTGATAKGIILEVEYLPCLSLPQCDLLIQECLSYITGPANNTEDKRILGAPVCDFEAVRLSPDKFSSRHTAFQYIQLLRSRRIL